ALNMDMGAARELLGVEGAHILSVEERKGARALGPELTSFCETRGLVIQSNAEFLGMVDRMYGAVVGLQWVLMSLVLAVASLGVANTLAVNVLEQTRELGVLRALGMKRTQVAKMIVAQALAMGLIGFIPGTLGGIVLALLVNRATHVLAGNDVPFHL